MKTLVEIIILLILIAAGAIVYGLHVGSPNNFINQELRSNILKSTLTRSVMALNDPGDYRYQYLGDKAGSLTIEVDVAPSLVPNNHLEDWLKSMVKDTTGKTITFSQNYDGNIPPKADFTYTELISLAKKTRDPLVSAQSNYLHILYVPRSSNDPTNAGMVLTATDIFIFKSVINELSNQDNIRARIEQSTLMHEWGHLLGLEHTEQDNCVMSEKVEVYPERKYQANSIPTIYCPNSFVELNRMKLEAKKK